MVVSWLVNGCKACQWLKAGLSMIESDCKQAGLAVVESDCKLGCQWLKVVVRATPFRRVQVQQCLFIN